MNGWYDNYYDNIQSWVAKDVDSDLAACLAYNPQKEWDLGDVERVLAVWEGERDQTDWRWVIRLSGDRYVFLRGWCDYTGWD